MCNMAIQRQLVMVANPFRICIFLELVPVIEVNFKYCQIRICDNYFSWALCEYTVRMMCFFPQTSCNLISHNTPIPTASSCACEELIGLTHFIRYECTITHFLQRESLLGALWNIGWPVSTVRSVAKLMACIYIVIPGMDVYFAALILIGGTTVIGNIIHTCIHFWLTENLYDSLSMYLPR